MSSHPAVRILTTCADVGAIKSAAQAFLCPASVESVDGDAIRRLGAAECLIVGATDDARAARASGFDGAIIVLATARDADEVASFLAQGTRFAAPGDGAALSEALIGAVPLAEDGKPLAPDASTARTRRLIASGELAIALRHAINNPLAALMAEIQLLQLEARDDETRAASVRMLALVRRLTEMSRTMESVRDR